MRDGPSASCCHSAAHSASASSIVVDRPLIALQHGVEHRGVRLCAAGESADCCFCAKPLAAAEAFPIEALGREPFIHTSPDHDTDQDRLLAALRQHPQTRFTTRDGFTTYNMAAAGLGISFNQRLIAQKWDRHAVAQVPFSPPQFIELGIAVPLMREASPAAKKLSACAVRCIRRLTDQGA